MTRKARSKATNLSRRKFIIHSAAAAGGGLALGFQLPFGVAPAAAQGRRPRPAPSSTPGSSSVRTRPA